MNALDALVNGRAGFGFPSILGVFILFCRIGGCIMLAPGFSSSQIPARIRLFVAIAITLSLSPILIAQVPKAAEGQDVILTFRYVGSELFVGITIGFLGRLFLFAIETLGVAAASGLGLANIFGVELDQNDALPPVATFISLSATALIFITNLHLEILRGLIASYSVTPVSDVFRAGFSLSQVAHLSSSSFRVALRIFSPFLIYALIVNLAISLINRLAPQIAIFYLAAPFVIGGGMILLYFVFKSTILEFLLGFSAWLAHG